jgi:hypothetical protein
LSPFLGDKEKALVNGLNRINAPHTPYPVVYRIATTKPAPGLGFHPPRGPTQMDAVHILDHNLDHPWSRFVSLAGAEQERKSWSTHVLATTLPSMEI